MIDFETLSDTLITEKLGKNLERIRFQKQIQESELIRRGGIKKDSWYNHKSGKKRDSGQPAPRPARIGLTKPSGKPCFRKRGNLASCRDGYRAEETSETSPPERENDPIQMGRQEGPVLKPYSGGLPSEPWLWKSREGPERFSNITLILHGMKPALIRPR